MKLSNIINAAILNVKQTGTVERHLSGIIEKASHLDMQ